MKRFLGAIVMFAVATYGHPALAGPLDPECTAKKAVRSGAAKAALGVGDRCPPSETVKDSAKRATGIEDNGPIEKQREDRKDKR